MPICARIGCPVRLGLTDEHKYCFGHRDCSLSYPCEICEHWTLATSRILLTDYNALRGSLPNRVFHADPAAPPTAGKSPLLAPSPAPPSQDDWGSLSSASSHSSGPHGPSHQSHAPLSRSDWSLSSRGTRLDYLPGMEKASAAPLSQPGPSVSFPPPAPPVGRSSSHRHRRRRRRPSWAQPQPGAPSAQPQSDPHPAFPRRPPRTVSYRPGPTFLPHDIHDDFFVKGSDLPWAKPLEVVSLTRSGELLPPPDPADEDVLLVSTAERLEPSAPTPLHPLTSKADKSPFPDVAWTEVETRAVHLIASILPDEVIHLPQSQRRQYPSSLSEPKRHTFHLPPVVLDEFDAITAHLEAPSSGNPGLSLTQPYQLHLQKWIPAAVFPLAYPAPDPDLDLLVKDPPTSLTTKVDSHEKRSRFFRAIVLDLAESALAQEAAFIASEGLLSTDSRPHLRIAENVRTAMALSKRRTDNALKLAIRGLCSDMLLHRDAILADSHTSQARRRTIRAAHLDGSFLFNQELAKLRNVLTPRTTAPPATTSTAPSRTAARASAWNASFRDRDSSRGRRQRRHPAAAGSSNNNNNNSSYRRSKPSAAASKPNSQQRSSRK